MSPQPSRRFARGVSIVLIVLVTQGDALAGGFQVTELCASCQGQRNAGMAAASHTPAAGFFNPATVGRLEGAGMDLGAQFIAGQFAFKDRGSTNAFGRPQLGEARADGAEPVWVPNLHLGTRLGERFGIGLSVTVPYGLVTEYPDDWVGRYHALKSELTTVNVNPAIAWNVTDRFTIGIGGAWQYADAELSNAVDFGALARIVLPETSPVPIPPELLPDSGDPALDGLSRLAGDDDGWGWTAGFFWRGDRTRIGAGYRAEIEHTLEGDVTVTLPPQVAELVGSDRRVEAGNADLATPQTVNLGLQHDMGRQWTLLLGATWTDWSSFEAIDVVDPETGEIISSQEEDWDAAWRFSAGAEYRYDPAVEFRFGLEYDQTPVPDDRLTARIPDADRYWLAAGVTWWLGERLAVDFAYTHIWVPDYSIRETESTTAGIIESFTGTDPGIGNTLRGNYDAEADVLSLGLRWGLARR